MNKLQTFFNALARDKERYLCAVNGIIGDHLDKSRSPLAVTMRLYPPVKSSESGGRICILANGSCASEKDWNFKGRAATTYGSLLQKDLGFTPFFLRYNSGLHISTNGRRFSALLEKFIRSYPVKVSEVILIGHSMGGLVFRSACHYGKKEKREWVRLVRKVFYLGSPHLGTHFEKLGKLVTTILNQIPNPVTKILASIGDLRSDGIKDLRHGYIVDEDWKKDNADNLFHVHRNKTPLLNGADHYLICSTLSKVAGSRLGRLFGDGLVHPASGTGRGLLSSNRLPFPKDHCRIIPGLSHYNLQKSRRVYQQIRTWCA